MKFQQIIQLILIAATLFGCGPKLDASSDEIQVQFEAALSPGDSASTIESYFAKRGLDATFDEFADRYQSTIRHPESDFHAISIYVNVDNNQQFVGVEAHDSYTLW